MTDLLKITTKPSDKRREQVARLGQLAGDAAWTALLNGVSEEGENAERENINIAAMMQAVHLVVRRFRAEMDSLHLPVGLDPKRDLLRGITKTLSDGAEH